MLKFSVLVDDDVHLPGCLPEKGLSLLLECDGLRVLFDSGRGRALRHNAEVMGVDLGSLTQVVLSHGHYDHVGGVGSLPAYPRPIPLIACPDVFCERATSCRCLSGGATSIACRGSWLGSRCRPEVCSPTARPSRYGSRIVWCSSAALCGATGLHLRCSAT